MFIAQNIKPHNPFWKYLAGSLIIIALSFIGQVPMMLAVFLEVFSTKKTFPTSQYEIMHFFDLNLTLFYVLLSFVFSLFGIYIVVRFMHQQTLRSIVTARLKIDWKRVGFSFLVWAAFSVLSTIYFYYTTPTDFVWNFKPIPFAILVCIATLLIPVQTSVEELIFRGYLMQGFGHLAKNKWFPLVLTSVIFGAMHICNPEIDKVGYILLVYYIGTGFLLGIMTLMDEGLELSLGFHAANNWVTAWLVTSDWTVFQTHSVLKDISPPAAGLEVLFPVFIVYPLLLFFLGKKYKWTNWKEKLTGKITLH